MNVQILLFDGFDELDALAPFEVLKNAVAAGAELKVALASADFPKQVTAAHGLRVAPDLRFGDAERPELLIVPGGGWNNRAPRGAHAEATRGDLPAAIARLHAGGATIAAVCTGTMLLAAAGILRGRSAVTHHGAIEDLRAAGAEVIPARVVDDGEIITAGGVTSGLDLGLWLVERFAGPQLAHAVERQMEYERRGTVWRKSAAAAAARRCT